MRQGYQNVVRITGAFAKTMKVQPGEKCLLCHSPATHKVETLAGGKPACQHHARQAKRFGYRVEPEL